MDKKYNDRRTEAAEMRLLRSEELQTLKILQIRFGTIEINDVKVLKEKKMNC
jgi:hypothetical protein